VKVAELTGDWLDYWVVAALGESGYGVPVERIRLGDGEYVEVVDFKPSQVWAHGGPIIDRDGIELHCIDRNGRRMGEWMARHPKRLLPFSFGPTPLIAAMRAFVASRFGEEVPDA
jgi:hypothetical protein